MRRYSPNKRQSVRKFNRKARRTNVKNVRAPMRGGIRL